MTGPISWDMAMRGWVIPFPSPMQSCHLAVVAARPARCRVMATPISQQKLPCHVRGQEGSPPSMPRTVARDGTIANPAPVHAESRREGLSLGGMGP
jgi:hypothetical protein